MVDFGQSGAFGGFLAAQQMRNEEMKTEIERGQLGIQLQELTQRRQKMMLDVAGNIATSLNATVEKLEAQLYKEAPFDPTPDLKFTEMVHGIAARLTQANKLLGMDEATAAQAGREVEQRLFRAASAPRQQTVSPNATIVSQAPGQITEQYRGPPAPTAGRTVEVPGELGVTRIVEGAIPAPPSGVLTGRQQQQPAGGGRPQAAAQPATTGAANAAPGQQGKALPAEAQQSITSSVASLAALDTITKNIGKSGLFEGRVSQLGAWLGLDKKAIDFQTARDNLKVQAQAIIKGIPSNFDVETFIETLPDITKPQATNQSRAEFTRAVLKQLIADTISYYKYSGHRIPENIVTRAKQAGIDPDRIEPYNAVGSATAKSEALMAAGTQSRTDAGKPEPAPQTSLDAKKYPGQRMKDAAGKIYRSNGKEWVEETAD